MTKRLPKINKDHWISLILPWISLALEGLWRLTVKVLQKHQLVPGAEKEVQRCERCESCKETATWWTWWTWWTLWMRYDETFHQGLWRWRPALQGSLKVGLKDKSRTSQCGSPAERRWKRMLDLTFLWHFCYMTLMLQTSLQNIILHRSRELGTVTRSRKTKDFRKSLGKLRPPRQGRRGRRRCRSFACSVRRRRPGSHGSLPWRRKDRKVSAKFQPILLMLKRCARLVSSLASQSGDSKCFMLLHVASCSRILSRKQSWFCARFQILQALPRALGLDQGLVVFLESNKAETQRGHSNGSQDRR